MDAAGIQSILSLARGMIEAADADRATVMGKETMAAIKDMDPTAKEVFKGLDRAIAATRNLSIVRAKETVALLDYTRPNAARLKAASETALASVMHACRAASSAELMKDVLVADLRVRAQR
ncbi:MAG: hypothetical protein AABY46_03400 [Nitrospirota bacterium]